jgi:hypothetical protein
MHTDSYGAPVKRMGENKTLAKNHTHGNHTHSRNHTLSKGKNSTSVTKKDKKKKNKQAEKKKQQEPKREIINIHVTDPKIVNKNVHWLSVRLISKLLKKLGDRRSMDDLEQDLIKRCPLQNLIPKLRDEVMNFKVVVASVGSEKSVRSAVSIENWKNIISAIINACPAVVKASAGYTWIAKARGNLMKDQNGKFDRIQSKADRAINRMAVFLRVTDAIVENKLFEIKEALRKQEEEAKARRLAIIKARKEQAEKRKLAKLAAEKKRKLEQEKAKKNKKRLNKNKGAKNSPAARITVTDTKKNSFIELNALAVNVVDSNKPTIKNPASKSNKKRSSKKTTAKSRSSKKNNVQAPAKPEPLYVNAMMTPVNLDVPWNNEEQNEFVKKTKINKVRNMTLSSLIARTIKFFARII